MSLTYADFQYYLGEKESPHNVNSNSVTTAASFSSNVLPNEFQVLDVLEVDSTDSLLQTSDPASQDFIIIAEFSEMEGPTPLCTIPNDAPSKTDIDLNNLAVHLMSTDYQVNTVGHFKVCEDTQVMRTNVFKNVHVFMQYFTLYDIKARGFVRPFCFGYVSKDHVKIDRNISKFSSEFDKITNILKHTNRQWFCSELQQYLVKLKNAKEDYINLKSQTSWQSTSELYMTNLNESDNDVGETGVFCLEDASDLDDISLNQIAHQYTEIDGILQIIKSTPMDPACEAEVNLLSHYIQHLPPKSLLKSTLENIRIRPTNSIKNLSLDQTDPDFELLNMPLVHPLKSKGESLRALTALGQLGTIILVWRLMRLELQKRSDFVFSEMKTLTRNFEKHCKSFNGNKSPLFEASVKTIVSDRTVLHDSSDLSEKYNTYDMYSTNGTHPENDSDVDNCGDDCEYEHFELIVNDDLCPIIEKINSAVPIVPDNKSGSYHSLSDESDVIIPSRHASGNENESSSYNSAIGSIESQKNFHDETSFKSLLADSQYTFHTPSESGAFGTTTSLNFVSSTSSTSTSTIKKGTHSDYALSDKDLPDKVTAILASAAGSFGLSALHERSSDTRCSISSYSSSDDDYNLSSGSNSDFLSGNVDMIEKVPWYVTMSGKMNKGQAGYGILKFFRHFHEVAHHVLYSILIGRPVVICGSETLKLRIGQILTALIPLVPCYPEKSWKLLRWHCGILVPTHFKHNSFKLIGLCIPERLVIHDLISPKDVTSVTILNVENHQILGPAYSGTFFSNFEQKCQKIFHDDVSLLGYLGCLFTEVETKVFMYKSLLGEGMKSSEIFRQLELKASDVDIVKHLTGLIHDVENVVEIF